MLQGCSITSSEVCKDTLDNQEKAVFYQNAHLERTQVNINKLGMTEGPTIQRNTGKDSLTK
jgi:hypothetical protein